MEKQVLAILEPVAEYADLLLAYLQEQKEFMFQIRVFTREDALQSFMDTTKVQVLLAAEESNYSLFVTHIDCIILLSYSPMMAAAFTYPVVYKFQSARCILREVCKICLETGQTQEVCYFSSPQEEKEQIVVFSPYGGVGKTLTAVILGHKLGEEKKVLVVNLEPFRKKYAWLHGDSIAGVSELIYFMKQEGVDLELKLQSLIVKAGNADYLQGISNYLDLQNMTGRDMAELLQGIKKHTRYEVVIFDVSLLNDATKMLLELCHVILEPVAEESQFSLWKQSFSYEEQQWLEKKRKSVPVVFSSQYWYEDLEYLGKCELGQSIYKAYSQEELTLQ